MEILSCENVAFKYNESTDYAISDCTFSVKKGEKIMLCGASGSGKSTLLRLLKRELSPRGELSGNITLMGKDRSELSDRESAEKIGFVMQSPDSQTVCDKVSAELAFGLESFGVKSGEIQSRVGEMAAFFGIESLYDRDISTLSGGQKQRVGIARALASDPKILLCDEATSALDPQTTKSILSLLKDINKRLGITVILITHEMAVVKEICDRVAVIEGGVIKEQGRVIDIFTNPTSDTMKEFVKSVINMELPQGIRNMGLTDQPSPDSLMLVRLRFKGNVTNNPLVVHVARKFNIDVSVLYGNIDYIQNVPFGYLIVVIMGDMENQTKAYSYIKSQPIESEVLGYVPRNN